jgi:hypothetical protein
MIQIGQTYKVINQPIYSAKDNSTILFTANEKVKILNLEKKIRYSGEKATVRKSNGRIACIATTLLQQETKE